MSDRTVVFDGSNPHPISKFLKNKIEPLLPYSLSLYRRCQFYLGEVQKQETNVGNARIWVGIANSSVEDHQSRETSSDDWIQEQWLSHSEARAVQPELAQSNTNKRQDQEWLSAYIDLTNPGETQVWLFASWELENIGKMISKEAATVDATTRSNRTALFQRLYDYLRREHVPLLSRTAPQRWQSLLDSGKLVSTPYIRSKILFGSIGESIWEYLESDVVRGGSKGDSSISQLSDSSSLSTTGRTRQDLSYLKYLMTFPVLSSTSTTSTLPTGFCFGPLSDIHFQIMLDRTVIPRTIETLQSLISVGIFLEGTDFHGSGSGSGSGSSSPIAWGLLGKDGSISSLHTEEGYRGKGLAEHVSRELARLHATDLEKSLDNLNDSGDHSKSIHEYGNVAGDEIGIKNTNKNKNETKSILTHADVSITNKSSQRVFEKMGGKAYWTVGWIELDIGE